LGTHIQCIDKTGTSCQQIEGVASVEADRRAKLITLRFDPSLTTRARVVAAVDDVVASIP